MSQKDIPIAIPAGQEKNLPVNEYDFLFLKSAPYEITVTIDQQPLKMQKGDVTEQSGMKSITLTNNGSVDIIVTVTVGKGRYNRVIVSGELNVSAYVSSEAIGESKSLPLAITKTVGVIDTVEETVLAGQSIQNANTGPAGNRFAVTQHDGEFYAVHQDNLYRFNKAAGGWAATLAWDLTSIGGSWPGHIFSAGVTAGGTIYMIAGSSLYRASLNDRSVVLLQANIVVGTSSARGGGLLNNKFYFSEKYYDAGITQDVNYLRWYDLETGGTGSIAVPVSYGQRLYVRGDYLYMSNNGSDTHNKLNPETGDLIEEVTGLGTFTGGLAFSETEDFCFYGDTSEYDYGYSDAGQKYGTIYVENTGDSSTRKEVLLKEPVEWFTRGADTVMTGAILKPIFKGIALNEGDSYLDDVVSFAWTDGITQKKLDGGTKTLKLRGIDDYFSIALTSEVSVSLIGEAFE